MTTDIAFFFLKNTDTDLRVYLYWLENLVLVIHDRPELRVSSTIRDIMQCVMLDSFQLTTLENYYWKKEQIQKTFYRKVVMWKLI